MWLSKKTSRIEAKPEPSARTGVVTIGGDPAGVMADGEYRQVAVLSPGGYMWRPGEGQSLLIIKDAGGQCCAVGAVQNGGDGLQPGEVRIVSGQASLTLKNNGVVEIDGNVQVTGSLSLNGEAITPAAPPAEA